MRPAIVWFGEMLPEDEWIRAVKAAQSAKIFLVIGTSALVYPAAGLVRIAHESGSQVVIVNPDPTPADELARWLLRGTAGDILPRLI